MIESIDALESFLESFGPFAVAVWDFDGVVADTEPVQARAYELMLSDRGITVPDSFFEDLVGRSEPEIWSELKQRYSIDEDVGTLREERIRRLIPMLASSLTTNWFVRPGVAALKRMGTPSVVVSSGNVEVIDQLMTAWDVGSLFDSVSATTGGADVSKRERLKRTLAVRGASLVIEDSVDYLRLAGQLGAVTLGVRHSLSGDVAAEADRFVEGGAQQRL